MTQLLEAEVSNGEPNYIVQLLGCVSSEGWQRGDHLTHLFEQCCINKI